MLDSIYSVSKTVKYQDAEIEIKQIYIGDIPYITKLVKLFTDTKKQDVNQKIIKFIEEDFEIASELVSRLTNIPKENFNKVSLDAAIFIIGEIVKENADFLAQKVVPQVTSLIEA